MNQIKSGGVWFYLAIVISLICVFLIYRHIDQSVTLDHQKQQNISFVKSAELLKKMLEVKMMGMTKDEVAEFIQKNFTKEYLVKEESNSISIDNIVLTFKDQKLISVEDIN